MPTTRPAFASMAPPSPSAGTPPGPLRFADLRPADVVDVSAMPRVLRRVMGLAAPYWRRLALATVATLGAAVASLALPHMLGRAVDEAHAVAQAGTTARTWAPLATTATLVLLLGVARGMLLMTSGYQGEAVGQRVGYDLRLAFFGTLQDLGFDFHDQVHTGELITRGMLDLEGVRGFIEQGLQRLVLLALLLGVGATMMALVDPLMTVLALGFVPVVATMAARTGLVMRVTWTRLQERMALLTRTMEENLQGVRVVRAYAAKAFELARFDRQSQEALRLANYRIRIRAGAITAMQTAFFAAMALVLWVGAMRVAAGRMSVGQLTQFLAFMTILQQPVRQIIMIVNSAARATSSGQRLFEILDRAPAIADPRDAVPIDRPAGHVRFEAVRFAYPGAEHPALADIDFEVRPGRLLGIVGAPGSGKSTIAHLIPRFYDVAAGRITLDGHDVRTLSLTSLRTAVAIAAQDIFLFDQPAAANIAYAVPDAAGDRIVAAARAARIDEHIAAMPLGYATPVGERGVSLSGGQRQRMSIARSLAPDPALLILDDSLSAVDTATEAQLRASLRASRADKATIIIAHRLSAVMDADEIIVLDRGRIVERGTHLSLMALGGRYAALYRMQADQPSRPEMAETMA